MPHFCHDNAQKDACSQKGNAQQKVPRRHKKEGASDVLERSATNGWYGPGTARNGRTFVPFTPLVSMHNEREHTHHRGSTFPSRCTFDYQFFLRFP